MTTTNDRHARAIARLIRYGHSATEDEATDLLARLILRSYTAEEVAAMDAKLLAFTVDVAKKGVAR